MDPINLPPDKREHTSYKVAVLGLAAVAFACLLKILEIPIKDRALYIAMYSFAMAIPLLISTAMTSEIIERDRYTKIPLTAIFVQFWMSAGRVIALLGVIALLWHFQIMVAIVFMSASIVGLILYIIFGVLMNNINPDLNSKLK